MIIEMRTYTLRPGTMAEVEKRFGEALPNREKHDSAQRLAAIRPALGYRFRCLRIR